MTDAQPTQMEITIRTARDRACHLLDGLTQAYTRASCARGRAAPAQGGRPGARRARLRRAIDQTRAIIGRLDRAIDEPDATDLARSETAMRLIAHDLDKVIRFV